MKNIFCKKTISFSLLVFLAFFCALKVFSQDIVRHNPWSLIIYRPENGMNLNEVRCWLKIQDENGNDVTYTCAKATYEWTATPNFVNRYERTYYLEGGMAMHLQLKPGKYKISFYTPPDKQNNFICSNKGQWESNVFEYNTENPTKVIFVCPTANDNGFYDGGWYIDYKAPKFYIYTKPKR